MVVAKILLVLTWLFCVGSMFFAPVNSPAGAWGTRIFRVLLIAHAIECVVFLPKLRKLPGSLGSHLLQTMVFGIVHLRSAEPAADD